MSQENVACRLHQVLAGHHSRPMVGVTALADELLEHGRLRLFGLEEQRVLVAQAHQKQDPRAGTNAPHTHHLAGDLHELELLEEVAAIGLETSSVAAHELVERIAERVAHLLGEQVLDGHEEGRIADDAESAVDDTGELAEGLQTVPSLGLGHRLGSASRHAPVGPGPRLGGGRLEFGQ